MTAPVDIAAIRAELIRWPSNWKPDIDKGDPDYGDMWTGKWEATNPDGEDATIDTSLDEDYCIALANLIALLVNTAPALLDELEAVQLAARTQYEAARKLGVEEGMRLCESLAITECDSLRVQLELVTRERDYEKELSEARKIVRSVERKIVRDEHLTELQRESARVNEMGGVIAHLVGVLAEVHRATSIDTARTFAEIALANIEAWHADAWKPEPSDDAADWKPGHWRTP